MKNIIFILVITALVLSMGFKDDLVKAQNTNGKFYFSSKQNTTYNLMRKKKRPKRPSIKNPSVGGEGKQPQINTSSSSSGSSSNSSSSSGGNTSGGNDSSSGGGNTPPNGGGLPGGGVGNPPGGGGPVGGGGLPPGGGIPAPVPNIDCNFTSGDRGDETACCRSQCMALGNPGEPGFEACVAGCVCQAHSVNGGDTTECFDNCRANRPNNQYCANGADIDECCRATCINRNCAAR